MDDTTVSRLLFGINPGYTKLPDNINLIWKIIIGEKIITYIKLKLIYFFLFHIHIIMRHIKKRETFTDLGSLTGVPSGGAEGE